jgi:hypothetical protein
MTFCLNDCADGGTQPGGTLNAPSNLLGTVNGSPYSRLGSNAVILNWTDNASDPYNEDVFIIERCQESGESSNITCDFALHATVGRDVTTFSEPQSSGTYRYRVKARRGSDEDTGYSNEVRI